MKFILNKKIIFLIIPLIFIPFFSKIVFAVWDGSPYDPGEVDNPECLPSQTNCDVLPAITSESDPIFVASDAFTISGLDISNWDTSYGWGNHANAGYVTGTPWTTMGYVTGNPWVSMGYITDGNTGWDNSYGFLTSYTETDPIFTAWDKSTGISVTESQISDLQNYLTSYTETDPVFSLSPANSISNSDITKLSNTSGTNTGDETLSSIKSKLGITVLSGSNTGDQDLSGLVSYTGATNDLDLGAHNFTVDTNTFFVDSVSNKVGIGTINPITTFDVNSMSIFEDTSYWGNSLVSYFGLMSWDSDNFKFRSGVGRGVAFETNGTSGPRLVINSSGNVGINKVNPTERLDVDGVISSDLGLNIATVSPPGLLTASPVLDSTPGRLSVGQYYYRTTFYTAIGETSPSAFVGVVTDSTHLSVDLTNIPISSNSKVIGRKIYRTKVGFTSDTGYLLTTIANNTTTTYTDIIPDSSLTGDNYVGYKANLTSKYISVNGTRSMIVDPNLTVLGYGAGASLSSGNSNVFLGDYAGGSTTYGTQNVFLGSLAGRYTTTGNSNIAIGRGALYFNSIGSGNIAISPNLGLFNHTNGSQNIILGYSSLQYLTSGSNNMALGGYSGRYIADGVTGLATSNNSLYIGYNSRASANGVDNENVFGVNAIGNGSNSFTLGSDSITKTILKGNIGIGTTAPTYSLDIKGVYNTSGVSSQAGYNIELVAAPIAPTYTLSAGGSVDTGTHYYFVTYTTAIGETGAGSILTAVTTTGNNTVNLTIPVSTDPRVTGRKIYRTKINTSADNEYLLATIANNTSTTYVDTTADSSLTGQALQYYRVNSTSNYFTVGGVKTMIADVNLTAFGRNTGQYLYGSYAPIRTTLFGNGAGGNITTGTSNHIFGVAGTLITTGSSNSLFGDLAGYIISSGTGNSIFGGQAGRYVTTGGYNTFYGNGTGAKTANGGYNTFIGANANDQYNRITGDYSFSTALGAYSYNTKSYQTVIGADNERAAGYATLETIINGDTFIKKETSLGSENLTNGALTSGTSWVATNDCSIISDKATWTYSSGLASTFTQLQTDLTYNITGSRWYKFVYTVSGVAGTPTATITTATSMVATNLYVSANGTYTVYFQSAASPTNFVISSTLTTGQAFTLDTFSLKEVIGGDLQIGGNMYANKNLTIGQGTNTQALTINGGHIDFRTGVTAPQAGMVATLAGAGAGNVDNGDHYYYVKFVTATGQTGYDNTSSALVTVVDKTTNGQVNLTNIPLSKDPRVTQRKIYRSAINRYSAYLLATLSNNTTTTYTDNTSNANLNYNDVHYNSSNTIAGKIFVDGELVFFAPSTNLYAGYRAGRTNTGGNNAFLGNYAGQSATAVSDSVIVGTAGGNLTTGGSNVIVGAAAMSTATTAGSNVAIGYYAGNSYNGSNSVYIGPTAGINNTTGNYNVIVGSNSGYSALNKDDATGVITLGAVNHTRRSNEASIGDDDYIFTTSLKGRVSIRDKSSLGSETLNNGSLSGGTYWSATNDCSLTSNAAVFTYNTGLTSTLTQTQANLATSAVGSRWYKFTLTVSAVTGTPTATLTTSFAGSGTSEFLPVDVAGTYTFYFKSATTPTDFVVTSTLTSGQSFTLDSFSLREVQEGSLELMGVLTGGGTSGIKVLSNGNVGIGTINPTTKLDVQGFIKVPDNNGLMGTSYGENTLIPDYSTGGHFNKFRAFSGQIFETYSTGFYNEKMRLTDIGNLGIGTNNPDEKLVINTGNGLFRFKDYLMSYSNTLSILTLNNGDLNLGTNTGTGILTLKTNATERMRITNGGNVGIGNSSPAVGLELGSDNAGLSQIINSTIGPELAPSFGSANWTTTNGWSADGVGTQLTKVSNASVGTITPSGSGATPIVGVTYKIVITASATSGQIYYSFGGTTGGTIYPGSVITATTITDYLTANNTNKLVITGAIGSTATITSVSIKALTSGTGDLTVFGNLRTNKVAYFNSGHFNPTIYLNNTIYLQGGYGGNPALLYINAGVTAPSMYLTSGFIQLGANTAGSSLLQKGSTNNTTEIRGGTSTDPQIFRIYNTYTSISNYERLSIGQVSNVITFASEAAGAGVLRNFNFTGGNVGIDTTNPVSKLEIGSLDLGNGLAGPVITLGRNTNATNQGAGSINFLDKSGLNGYVWQDSAGNLRINNSAPTTLNDTAGIIVGAQTSERATKQDIEDYIDYSNALSMIVSVPLHTFRYVREVSGYGPDSPLAKAHIGYIADEVDSIFMSGNVIDQVSINGLLMASIKELNLRLEDIALPPTEESQSFAERFFNKLRSWLASPENGLEQICVKKSDGTEFCVNGDQLEQVMTNLNIENNNNQVINEAPSENITTDDSTVIDSPEVPVIIDEPVLLEPEPTNEDPIINTSINEEEVI